MEPLDEDEDDDDDGCDDDDDDGDDDDDDSNEIQWHFNKRCKTLFSSSYSHSHTNILSILSNSSFS